MKKLRKCILCKNKLNKKENPNATGSYYHQCHDCNFEMIADITNDAIYNHYYVDENKNHVSITYTDYGVFALINHIKYCQLDSDFKIGKKITFNLK